MKKKQIVQSLKHVQRLRIGGDPDSEWVQDARASLLARVNEDAAAQSSQSKQTLFIDYIQFFVRTSSTLRLSSLAYRPVLASVMAFFVVLGSGIGAVSASWGTIPGDTLYPVKIASERAHLAVSAGNARKTKLKMEFVGRRAAEVNKISKSDDDDRLRQVGVATRNLRADLDDVKDGLNEVREKESAMVAAEVAILIDEKTEEVSQVLDEAEEGLTDIEKVSVKEAQVVVDDVSVQAVALLIDAHAEDESGVNDEELTETVDKKIKEITDSAEFVVDANTTSTPSEPSADTANQALDVLDEAREFLDQKDYSSAFSKVIEGKELTEAAEQIVNAEATALTTLSATSSTLSEPTITSSETNFTIEPQNQSTTSSSPEPQANNNTSNPTSGMTSSTDAILEG